MIFYNIGINIPNFLCWIPNMKFACVQTSPVISFVARGKGATKEIGDVCTQANMKSVFWRQKNPKLDPKFSHNIYQHWNEHSQCMTSISQHPLWNCISQSHFVPLQFCYSLFQFYYANINSVIQFPILLFAFDLCSSKSGTSCNKLYFSRLLCKIW